MSIVLGTAWLNRPYVPFRLNECPSRTQRTSRRGAGGSAYEYEWSWVGVGVANVRPLWRQLQQREFDDRLRVDRCNQVISGIEQQVYSWHWTKVDVQIKMSGIPAGALNFDPHTHSTTVKWKSWKVNPNYRRAQQWPFPHVGQVNFLSPHNTSPNFLIRLFHFLRTDRWMWNKRAILHYYFTYSARFSRHLFNSIIYDTMLVDFR